MNGEAVPWAAEAVRWLRYHEPGGRWCGDGMRFHDGTPVTAEDVQYSFEVPKRTKRRRRSSIPNVVNIDKVTIVEPKTLRFTLKAPQSSFLTTHAVEDRTSSRSMYGSRSWTAWKAPARRWRTTARSKRIGSGPFRFVHWREPEEVMLERNDKHWSPPKLDRWILRTVSNQEATLGMLRNGEINFLAMFTGDPQNVAALAQQEPKIQRGDDNRPRHPVHRHEPPPAAVQTTPAFRRCACRPRSAAGSWSAAAWNGFAEPAGSCVSSALPFWHEADSLLMGGDLTAAKEILAKAGYTLSGGELHYPAGKT